jgi:hypothetical protein
MKYINTLFRVQGEDGTWRISKTKVTAVIALLAPLAAAAGLTFVGDNLQAIETALLFIMGIFLRDGITS